jgi:hypothetical protein
MEDSMSIRQRRYDKEEFARRGMAIYEEKIRPLVEADHRGEIVMIDIETGEWEMDPDEIAAAKRLEARIPDAQIWMQRIGYPYVHRFGYHSQPKVE